MSDNEIAISVKNLSKSFRLPHEKQGSIKNIFVGLFKGKTRYEKQKVLKDISFDIKKGEFFGIVGRNGSGKSTLLKLLAGVYSPSQGRIDVNGKLTPFIELGVGFNPELTGRENVYLNGALLGFDRAEMNAMYNEIVRFAELEKFMDQKLKNYSSGMQVRLAFSIAIRAKTAILLLDEVLAVGDAAFQQKCYDYFEELKNSNKTVVFVSHDRTALGRFCDSGILLDQGMITCSGSIDEVLSKYSEVVLDQLVGSGQSKGEEKISKASKYAAIEETYFLDDIGDRKFKFKFGEKIYAEFKIKVLSPIKNPVLGITLWEKHTEKPLFATNTLIEGKKTTGEYIKGETLLFRVPLPGLINDGEYLAETAITDNSTSVVYDQSKSAKFYVSGSNNAYSLLSSDTPIEISRIKT